VTDNFLLKDKSIVNFLQNIFLIYVFFLLFFGGMRLPWLLLDLFLFTSLVLMGLKSYRMASGYIYLAILFSAIVLFLCVWVNGISSISIAKSYYYLKPMVLISFFAYLSRERTCQTFSLLKKLHYILLAHYIFNFPIIYWEYATGVELDDRTGLVGVGGTQILMLTWLVLLSTSTLVLRYSLFVCSLLLFSMLYLAVLSDSKAFFLMSALLMFQVALLRWRKYFWTLIIVFSSLAVFAVFALKFFAPLFYGMLSYKFSLVAVRVKALIGGNVIDERLHVIIYSLGQEGAMLFGQGVGYLSHVMGFYGVGYYDMYRHQNISDLSLLIVEIGLIPTAVLMVSFFLSLASMYKRVTFIGGGCLFSILLFCFYYFPLLSDPRIIVFVSIVLFVFSWFGSFEGRNSARSHSQKYVR